MVHGLVRSALAFGVFAAATALLSAPAEARVGVAFGFGFPLFPPPIYYAPPPPVYYAPPPVYYAPPPAAYAPPAYAPAPTAAASQVQAATQGETCREYQTSAIIDGKPQQTYGTACLQPDGSWRIVR